MPFLQTHAVRGAGPKSHKWRGGRFLHATGYIYVWSPEHPNVNAAGYVLEHRLVMEKKLGRLLERTERVHHINGDKEDNREENLELSLGNHGPGVCLKCEDCGSTRLIPTALIPGAPRWLRHRPPLSKKGR